MGTKRRNPKASKSSQMRWMRWYWFAMAAMVMGVVYGISWHPEATWGEPETHASILESSSSSGPSATRVATTVREPRASHKAPARAVEQPHLAAAAQHGLMLDAGAPLAQPAAPARYAIFDAIRSSGAATSVPAEIVNLWQAWTQLINDSDISATLENSECFRAGCLVTATFPADQSEQSVDPLLHALYHSDASQAVSGSRFQSMLTANASGELEVTWAFFGDQPLPVN